MNAETSHLLDLIAEAKGDLRDVNHTINSGQAQPWDFDRRGELLAELKRLRSQLRESTNEPL